MSCPVQDLQAAALFSLHLAEAVRVVCAFWGLLLGAGTVLVVRRAGGRRAGI